MALRRCPICAALLGLMLECSTRILPGGNLGGRLLVGGKCRRPARRGRPSTLRYPGGATCNSAMPSIGPISARIASAIFSGAERSGLAKGNNGDRKVPEFDLRWLLNDDFRQRGAGIAALQTLPHTLRELMSR